MIKRAIQALLAADSGITDELSTYDTGGVSEEPAIFTKDQEPSDALTRFIVIDQVGGSRFGVRANRGAEIDIHVRIVGSETRSDKALRDIAFDVWRLIDRAPLDLTSEGYGELGVLASPPISLDDPDEFPGYVVPVTVRILEV